MQDPYYSNRLYLLQDKVLKIIGNAASGFYLIFQISYQLFSVS